MNQLRIICINNKNRPNEIPNNRWLEIGKEYTVLKLMKMKQQNGIAGVKLVELNNDDLFPYQYFRLNRFAITQEELEKLLKEVEIEELV